MTSKKSKKKKNINTDDTIAFTDICETGVYIRTDVDTDEYLVALPIDEDCNDSAAFIFVYPQVAGPAKIRGTDGSTIAAHRTATYVRTTHLDFSGMIVMKEQL